MMIELSTGAVLGKELELADFKDRGGNIGLCETFIPCRFCLTKCKKCSYNKCMIEYTKLWKKKYKGNEEHERNRESVLYLQQEIPLQGALLRHRRNG